MKKKLHSNASLTIPQRIEVKRLYEIENVSIAELARRFCVGETTIRRWIERDSPEDKPSTPHNTRRIVTNDYEQAVIEYRRENPTHGAIRIAYELKEQYPIANRGTVSIILKKHGLTKKNTEPRTKRKKMVSRYHV